MALRGEELLIAACPQGLLAGAPSGALSTSRTEFSGKATPVAQHDSDPQGRTSLTPDGDGESVGMILVCEHSTSSDRSNLDEVRRQRDLATGSQTTDDTLGEERVPLSATGTEGPLEPGVYCVKQSGSSVWLTDEAGLVVLRSTIDAHHGARAIAAGDNRGQARSDEVRGAKGANGHGRPEGGHPLGSHDDWEHVFGAITKEVMTSMGWSKAGTPSSMR